MSSAFDKVELALRSLSEESNLNEDQRALVSAVQRVVVEWHDLNHKQDDAINLKTPPGTLVSLVDARNRLSQSGA